MDFVTIIGLFAATCTTCAFLPQVVKTIKTKDTKSISLSMYLILVSGILLWLIYGILIKDIPLIAANSITIVLALLVLILKIKYG